MRRPALTFAALLAVLAGCASGLSPDVHPAPAPSPRAADVPEGSRAFLDSLAAASPLAASAPALGADTAAELSWLRVLRDTQLVALVRTALLNNNDLEAATARVREYRAYVGAARGLFLPEIDVGASASHSKQIFGTLSFPPFDAMSVTAFAGWEVDFFGRLRRNAQAAAFDRDFVTEDRRAVVLSLVADVADTYLELRELDRDVEIAQRTLETRQVTLRLARNRFQQGVISELDVRQFESEAASAAIRVAQFTQGRSLTENRLSILLGRAPGPIPRGASLEETVQAVTVPDSLPSALLAGRPDVMRSRADWSAAMARIGVAAAARLPRVTITASYGSQATYFGGLFGSGTDVYTVQAGISMPLFTGGRVLSQQRAAEARADQARARFEQTVLVSLRETSDALASIRLTRDALGAQESQVRALRRALELAERRYGSGVSSNLEVLDAERGLFAAELGLVQVQRLYLEATVQLYKVLGGSWTESR
jgi:multidrug efflux system outer membrane protein